MYNIIEKSIFITKKVNMSFITPEKQLRRRILFFVLVVAFIGLLMVYEASSFYGYRNFHDALYFFKRQLISFFIGLIMFFCMLVLDLRILRKYAKQMLIFTILLMGIVLIAGKTAGGAKRWVNILFFSGQPSELLKLSFLFYCVDYLYRKKGLIGDFSKGVLPIGIVSGLICLLALLQSDLGTAVFWAVWLLLMLFLTGASKKVLGSICALGMVFVIILVLLFPYRVKRITAYINPFSDPHGAGYQLIQSQIAYAQGGFWGVGLGEGKQKLFFLPAAHTDFIFSIYAEEFGFLGVVVLMTIFCCLFYWMFITAGNIRNYFLKLLCLGIIFIFFLEIIVNIGVSGGLFPTKGLPLPFMSYGGSSLVIHFILIAVFINASMSGEKQVEYDEKEKS